MKNSAAISTILVLALAGCTTLANPLSQTEIDGLILSANDFLSVGSPTENFDMPSSGQATYTGLTTLAASADLGSDVWSAAIGELTLTADFSAASISGEATRFVEIEADSTSGNQIITVGDAITGTLSYDNGVIVGATFGSLDMTGSLTYSDGTEQGVDIEVYGAFYTGDGNEAEVIFGVGGGTTTIDGVDTISETEIFLVAD